MKHLQIINDDMKDLALAVIDELDEAHLALELLRGKVSLYNDVYGPRYVPVKNLLSIYDEILMAVEIFRYEFDNYEALSDDERCIIAENIRHNQSKIKLVGEDYE